MHERGKSDSPVVPAKPLNKAGLPVAEAVEERGLLKGNATSSTRPGHSAGVSVPSGLDRVRRVAKQDKDVRFTALLHHVDVDRLRAAYWALNPKAATGVDGVTWVEYGLDLEENLRDLHARVHRGAYRARPSRRAYIPKADGRLRPLGISVLEDKLLQRAVVEVLNAIYEADFLGFSYGFRAGRSQHQALDALAVGILRGKVNYVLDADIRGYFDSIDRSWMLRFLEHRIADRRVLRLIRKWLSAGVIENGEWSDTVEGTPQGASVSPLLSNVYLHYVFDLWADRWRRRHARGDVVIVRYADDYIVGFQHESDARRFLAELRDRLAKFCLELAAEKTRLIEFGRYAAERRQKRGLGRPETFDFLGFTHCCAKALNGGFLLKRITIKKRLRAKLREVKEELKRRRHQPVPEQGQWLARVVQGHCAYYAVPGNYRAIETFRSQATRHWYKALRRRSHRSRLTWERMKLSRNTGGGARLRARRMSFWLAVSSGAAPYVAITTPAVVELAVRGALAAGAIDTRNRRHVLRYAYLAVFDVRSPGLLRPVWTAFPSPWRGVAYRPDVAVDEGRVRSASARVAAPTRGSWAARVTRRSPAGARALRGGREHLYRCTAVAGGFSPEPRRLGSQPATWLVFSPRAVSSARCRRPSHGERLVIDREGLVIAVAHRCLLSATSRRAMVISHHITKQLASERITELRRQGADRREPRVKPKATRRLPRVRKSHQAARVGSEG